MGVETENIKMPVYDAEDGYISDSEAFASVISVLDGVRMASVLVAQSDRDQYDYLLSIVDPGKKMGPDEEALLATALKALSGAVFKVDIMYHGSLLSNIFGLCIWNYGFDARNAFLELITSLAAIPDKFLDDCLNILVSNFRPPPRLCGEPRWLTRKKEIHNELRLALQYITTLVPLAPVKLKNVIDKRMPRCTDSKDVIVLFVECMLGLEKEEVGRFIGTILLEKVVDLLTDLDVNIPLYENYADEVQFEMELDALKSYQANPFAGKLDGLMVTVCEHLKSRAGSGHLLEVFESLLEIFQRSVLRLHKARSVQFLIFYACSLDPDTCGLKFAILLTDIFLSKTEDLDSRMKAVAYLSSYLARARFIPASLVASILKRLVDWCYEYCLLQNSQAKWIIPQAHRLFYSGCQAVMYIICFRLKSILDLPHHKQLLSYMPLDSVLCHPALAPLQVCAPHVVKEFLNVAKASPISRLPMPNLHDDSIETKLSKAFGGIQRLDVFFPFDPYLLKESDRFMRPNFLFWEMVKEAWSEYNIDSENELAELDAPNFSDEAGFYEENDDLDSGDEVGDDEVDVPFNSMSISPKPAAFQHPISTNFNHPSRMPARIRPSVSPPRSFC